jgi:predicted nucleic acid-binding protein
MSKEMFIIDADALIHAYRYDFPPSGNHSGFWEWLDKLAESLDIFIPESVITEIKRGNDGLAELLNTLHHLKNLATQDALKHVPTVMNAYGTLTELDLEIIGNDADPYIIAHAIELKATVVTNEIPEPGRTAPRNKKIPDICAVLKIPCVRYPHFIWEMRGLTPS